MAGGKTLDFDAVLHPDGLAYDIARSWHEWDTLRAPKREIWQELRRYVFAKDTRHTTNSTLPWKNSTTIPKLCQIRDNLSANYMAAIFPKRKWLDWEGEEEESDTQEKREAILAYMRNVIAQTGFKREVEKLIYDFIDYGNCFCMPEWINRNIVRDLSIQTGYEGPTIRRISPLDIVFDPTAPEFEDTPKIIRSIVSKGQVKKILEQFTQPDTEVWYKELWEYFKDIRSQTSTGVFSFSDSERDAIFNVAGFTDYQSYLQSPSIELLTFYGDIYDEDADELLENHIIVVADRHKIIYKEPSPSFFGYPPIFHAGWRKEQDNLWAMGPLDNLVGLQYRMDHIENLKADAFDVSTFPVFKIKGYVQDFKWAPLSKVYVGDDGDVELMTPPVQILQVNSEIQGLEMKMEEMAGAPKEALGFRTPGEKTAFEVQRLENAASRIFNNKIIVLEELLEDALNGCLELGRRNFTGGSIRHFDDEYKLQTFMKLEPEDILGAGRLKPLAARHFTEKAEVIQNLNNLFNSPLGQSPALMQHLSGTRLADMLEDLLGLEDYRIFQKYVAITEAADAEKFKQIASEQAQMETTTPSGLTPDDYDDDVTPTEEDLAGMVGEDGQGEVPPEGEEAPSPAPAPGGDIQALMAGLGGGNQ